MGSQQTFKPTPSLIKIPLNYPLDPTPGKLKILWDANNKKLYRRLSPYTDYNQSLIGGATQEPFFYTFADESGRGLSGLKKYESRLFPIGSAPIDVLRTAKFLGSGNGIIFLGKQFLLQTGNPYNETRIYNPTSPLVAAGMGLALGTVRPQRNFDTSAGLGGIVRTLIGNAIPDALFGAPKINPPSGTVASALSDATLTTGGKGLLRAGTANRGLSHLNIAWPQNTMGSSLIGGFKAAVKGLVTSVFANFIPQNQNGIKARSDEGSYGLMVGAGSNKFTYIGRDGNTFGFGQQWIAGGKIIRKNGQYSSIPYRIFTGPNGEPIQIINDNLVSRTIDDVGVVGYTVSESTKANNPGYRYGDSIGKDKDSEYEASEIMVQYSDYVKEANRFPTKHTGNDVFTQANLGLLKTLDKLRAASGNIYTVEIPGDARVISSGQASKNGYDRLFSTNKKGIGPINYPLGLLQDYRNSRVVDNSLTTNASEKSLKLPGAGNFDAINTLTVLDKDKKIVNSRLRGWTEWQPYIDDQIALYFYDVVNEKYIPFRASIKGLTESSTANWEELQFIGRADKVYSYGGFNRNLSFSISICINSIIELAPTWKRVNYLTTLVKPANYTVAKFHDAALNRSVTNRFMIPPMVMLTLGDMYKEQPILINSITVTVPDDATWETTNQFNSEQWEYLSSYIKASGVLYGQLPKQVEIGLGLVLLEKERAIVGGANFGHAPRLDNDQSKWNTNTIPDGGTPSKLHSSWVVNKDNTPIE
jgi:hypothetical protein